MTRACCPLPLVAVQGKSMNSDPQSDTSHGRSRLAIGRKVAPRAPTLAGGSRAGAWRQFSSKAAPWAATSLGAQLWAILAPGRGPLPSDAQDRPPTGSPAKGGPTSPSPRRSDSKGLADVGDLQGALEVVLQGADEGVAADDEHHHHHGAAAGREHFGALLIAGGVPGGVDGVELRGAVLCTALSPPRAGADRRSLTPASHEHWRYAKLCRTMAGSEPNRAKFGLNDQTAVDAGQASGDICWKWSHLGRGRRNLSEFCRAWPEAG